ncbi:histidine kinase [Leptolyngbya sp. 'hensonii']|nr:histidine kinase [Leptolyngbya sp. 'hensonii']
MADSSEVLQPAVDLQPELVFTQDRTGQYLSFYWRDSGHYGLGSDQVVHSWMSDIFGPVAMTPYLDQICQVLESSVPTQFTYPFRCGDYHLVFDLTVSPVQIPGRPVTLVIVMGRLLSDGTKSNGLAVPMTRPASFTNPDRYQRLLTLISWNIRRTLDLGTIWKQTAMGLGKALQLDHCLVCSYKPGHPQVRVVAEYCWNGTELLLGQDLLLSDYPYLQQTLAILKPILQDLNPMDAHGSAIPGDLPPIRLNGLSLNSRHPGAPLTEIRRSLLAVATCYGERPNGIICLYRSCVPQACWGDAEVELVRELADQVGTAIAHATLFSDSHALTVELQRVNDSLVQKHRELEEAHQQAEEASRLKSEFLANTSHELRTPLNGMLGFLKLVMDGMADDPEEQQEFIEEAYRSALHLLNIINDILDIAKIEAGKMQLELNPVKLDDLFTDVRDFTAAQALQKQLSFEILKPATHDEIIVYGNYQRLLQVMLNLVGNAIKFTHEGGITISAEVIRRRVAAHNREFPGTVKVRVADTGIGVSLEKQDKLFQSFSQVDGSRTRQYGGTGLGLVISQKLVEAMAGVVNFYSLGEGLGSTVTFTVPLYQEPLMVSSQSKDTIDLLTP